MDALTVQLIGLGVGIVTGGVAIAAQKAVTSLAGYIVIRHSRAFTLGDRIKMGGVQGDVIALGFLQTRILEMGQPHAVSEQEQPGMWVRARQYSGRIVTVTNDKIFDEAVYNFSREFPYIWEEVSLGVPFHADYARAERILLEATRATTGDLSATAAPAIDAFSRKYNVTLDHAEPRVYWRATDNWLELTVRFLAPEHGIRAMKDRLVRRMLPELESAGIDIASTTLDITGLPKLQVDADTGAAVPVRQPARP